MKNKRFGWVREAEEDGGKGGGGREKERERSGERANTPYELYNYWPHNFFSLRCNFTHNRRALISASPHTTGFSSCFVSVCDKNSFRWERWSPRRRFNIFRIARDWKIDKNSFQNRRAALITKYYPLSTVKRTLFDVIWNWWSAREKERENKRENERERDTRRHNRKFAGKCGLKGNSL